MRNFGTERAEAVAALAAAHPHPYVTGFGLAGDEAGFPPGPFARAYEIAQDAGLGLTVHAGEWAGPESVRGGMELPVTRIGHGVRAIEEPALVAEIAARGLVLEVLPDVQRRARSVPGLRVASVRQRCAPRACR